MSDVDDSSRKVTLSSTKESISFLDAGYSSFPKHATMGMSPCIRSIASKTRGYSLAAPRLTISPARRNKSGVLQSFRDLVNSFRNLGLCTSATAAILIEFNSRHPSSKSNQLLVVKHYEQWSCQFQPRVLLSCVHDHE